MPNWTTITSDDLKASGHGNVIDRASTVSTGDTDPIAEEIANASARVRRAVSGGGNALDADASKVPNSLKGVTVRLALFALMGRIRFPLSEDQRKTREFDNSDLLRVADPKISTPIETPDDPAGTAEMATPTPGPRIIPRTNRQFTAETEDGA